MVAATESQALDVKRVSPRLTAGDGVVFLGALFLVLLGAVLKQRHDDRLTRAEVDGVEVAYPYGWFRSPADEPALLRASSDGSTRADLYLFVAPPEAAAAATGEETPFVAVAATPEPGAAGTPVAPPPALPLPEGGDVLFGGNPAVGEPSYTELARRARNLDGAPAIETEYAYVRTQVAASSPPDVIRGREVAWSKDGRAYVLALEAPAGDWDEVGDEFDRYVDELRA